jgi:hypothetical protein
MTILFLHGNFLDEALLYGAVGFVILLFLSAQLKASRAKKARLRRKAERMEARRIQNLSGMSDKEDKS